MQFLVFTDHHTDEKIRVNVNSIVSYHNPRYTDHVIVKLTNLTQLQVKETVTGIDLVLEGMLKNANRFKS